MAAPIVRVRVPQLARTGVRARLQPAEVVARSAGGVRARAGGCEIRAGAPRVRRAPATLTLQLVQIGQNPVTSLRSEKKSLRRQARNFRRNFRVSHTTGNFRKTFRESCVWPKVD